MDRFLNIFKLKPSDQWTQKDQWTLKSMFFFQSDSQLPVFYVEVVDVPLKDLVNKQSKSMEKINLQPISGF